MRGYLTKRPNSLYCLTYNTPVVLPVGNSPAWDVYAVGGDPLAWCSPICDFGRQELFRTEPLQVFQTVEIEFEGRQLGDPFMQAKLGS